MNLADHLRPLLRDHDCVIIPDFGGLVAEYTPAQVRPAGRHLIFPPTRQVAFNQALIRNDGLLVDTLRQHLGLSAPEAREAVRQAVAALHQQLSTEQRTELPGIGVFRQLPGRGLQFDYTGTDNLLAAAYGLPELTAHPVRVLDARQAREQHEQLLPRLRTAGSQVRWRRLVPGAAIGLLAGVVVAAVYLLGLHPEAAPLVVRPYLPRLDVAATTRPAPQQAALAQPSFALPVAPDATVPATTALAAPVPTTDTLAASSLTANSLTVSSLAAPSVPVAAAPAPAVLVRASSPAAVVPAPVAPLATLKALPQQVIPAQTAPVPAARLNPAEVLLLTPAKRPPRKPGKLPKGAAIALASEDNVAHPVPLALRQPGSKAMSTVYPVAPPTAKWSPTVGVIHTAMVADVPAAAAPTARPSAKVAPKAALAAAKAAPKATANAAPVAAAIPAKVPATAGAATINKRTGRFYVVVAAYNSLANAEKGRRVLAGTGRPAKVILPYFGTRFYRLSVADFPDQASANFTAAKLRQNPNFDKGLTVLPY